MRWMLCFAVSILCGVAQAGPYSGAAGRPGSEAIGMNDPSFAGWATGYRDYAPGPNADAAWRTPGRALGKATGDASDVVVLGDSGRITLTFGGSVYNGPGADFAVFENSFSDTFLELAWVEVSSDGTNFFRFPSFSLTANAIGAFGELDPTNLDGLAGKHRAGFGTPFDLDLLKAVPGLNVNDVRHVRIVDIVGDGGALDSLLRPIYDPYPTVITGGFDLDAVGVRHLLPVPEPGALALMLVGLLALGAIVPRVRRPTQAAPRRVRAWRVAVLAGCAAVPAQAAVVSTFDEFALAPESHFFPETNASFVSGAARFDHVFDPFFPGCCWSGWTYSNRTDTLTPGFGNQFSAFAGSGAEGSANYAIATFGDPTVELPVPGSVAGAYFTNTTYAAQSMLQGDAFAKKFGGASGDDPDYFRLTIEGESPGGATTGSVTFFLADYRFAGQSSDYIVRDWTFVDLSSLGQVKRLRFALDSSDVGSFGMNTPAYFAMDSLSITPVPEPSSAALLGGGLALLLLAGAQAGRHGGGRRLMRARL